MKKLTVGLAFSALAFATIIGSSCSKDDKKAPTPVAKTPQELIVGKWKSTYHGWDSNLNGTWDSTEKVMVPDSEVNYAVFKSDGSAIGYSKEDTSISTYKFTSDGKAFAIISPNENPDTMFISQLDANTMILRNPDGPTHDNYGQFVKVN